MVKLSKCNFVVHSVEYLGHIISKDGVSKDPSKIRAIQEWPKPIIVRQAIKRILKIILVL